jgi:hypothetical protein
MNMRERTVNRGQCTRKHTGIQPGHVKAADARPGPDPTLDICSVRSYNLAWRDCGHTRSRQLPAFWSFRLARQYMTLLGPPRPTRASHVTRITLQLHERPLACVGGGECAMPEVLSRSDSSLTMPEGILSWRQTSYSAAARSPLLATSPAHPDSTIGLCPWCLTRTPAQVFW